MVIKAYTDGSCNAKLKIGGLGVFAKAGIHEIRLGEGYTNTKTGRMELMAVIRLMEIVDTESRSETDLVIWSDSKYVVNSINMWLSSWIRNDSLGDKANVDLWKRFLSLRRQFHDLRISWVKGHSGVEGNEVADKLANGSYKEEKALFDNGFYSQMTFDQSHRDWWSYLYQSNYNNLYI